MAVDVIMPQMGESIFEGTITKWLKKPGDKIDRDEPLFEISTDKVDAEIPSPSAGVLKEIKVTEGQTVPIQTIVAVIDVDGKGAATAAAPKAEAQSAAPAATATALGVPPAAPAKPAPSPAPSPAPRQATSPAETVELPLSGAGGSKVRSSPLVRRMAREHQIDLSQVPGTGAGGRVSKHDLQAAMEGGNGGAASAAASGAPAMPSAPPPPPATGGAGASHAGLLESAVPRERMYFGQYEVQPMSIMRQKIAEHMVLSKRTSPHVYSVEEVDVTSISALRSKMKEKFEEHSGTKLTFMPFFIRAVVEGLRAFPTVNASIDGTNLVLHKECNIGVAVALDWGLIVPVIKNAEEKNFLGLARSMNDLALRARTKKLKPEEVAESTFSITNPGVYGGLFGLPVINQPNVAILGMGAIEKRPVVIDDAIAIRSMCYLTLSYDHRVVDGAVAHQFMGKVKHTLENWTESIL
ncbi:MAG TPA: 2-oxoglutarate dehydrogenase, E2 component, dihydrolipoamide succinyltransferase [Candidatus Acidoferrales bacterium]|jgi:2-oxoglutarate dehydrogenase E2 component (dihydrolipoamide succinyltransferase)|nr:2-oxoglutarate dehydrogenase, E2 component, dihydrolipoamide succinyltransferase [Candidatus Acidoferrales bacterium]